MYLFFAGLPAHAADCNPKELPDGYSSLGGWTIGDPYSKGKKYAMNFACKNNICDRFYLNRFLYHDKDGCAHFVSTDHVAIPVLNKGENYAFECSRNGKWEPEIVAFVRTTDEEYYTQIIHAWGANRDREKIEKITTQGIICRNESYGL